MYYGLSQCLDYRTDDGSGEADDYWHYCINLRQ